MADGSELHEIERMITEILTGDTDEEQGGLMTLTQIGGTGGGSPLTGVHSGIVGQGEPTPYLMFSLQSGGSDTHTLCGDTAGTEPLYLVRVVGTNCGFEGINAMEKRINTLLRKAERTTEDGMQITCRRESPFRQTRPQVGGVIDYHAGGLYRFTAS